jgi:hypothetical protein
MDSGFKLSPSKHARLIIYQPHCEQLLSNSWIENRPGRQKSNDKVNHVQPAQSRHETMPPTSPPGTTTPARLRSDSFASKQVIAGGRVAVGPPDGDIDYPPLAVILSCRDWGAMRC